MQSECLLTAHSADLNKISARIPEAREFLSSCEPERGLPWNIGAAFQNRWYGNASQQVCQALTRHFFTRFCRLPGQAALMKRLIQGQDSTGFPVVNHVFMLLADPYYRWAASECLPRRMEEQRTQISFSSFESELGTRLPPTVGQGSRLRYTQNLLTALRDNGLLSGRVRKHISRPALTARTLAVILYLLADWGIGAGEFDNSAIMRSLLWPRELLVPLFREGERLGYWEFNGDKNRLSATLRLKGLEAWMEANSA